MFLQFRFVRYDVNEFTDHWGFFLEPLNCVGGFGEKGVGPERAASQDSAVFAGYSVSLDVPCYFGAVLELEVCYIGCAVEEEGLEMAAILYMLAVEIIDPENSS